MRSARLRKAVVAAVLAIPVAALASLAVFLWRTDYDGLAHFLVVHAGKPHQEALFKARYFTPATHGAIQWLAAIAVAAGIVVTVFATLYAERSVAVLQAWWHSARAAAGAARTRFADRRPETKAALALLLTIQAASTLFRITHTPVSYDEAWTYLNFTSRPLYTALSYYPAPNNHILYSALTVITAGGPLPPLISMRLISLLFSLATTLALFGVGVCLFDERAVIAGVSLFAFSFPVSLYALQARGYAMLLFFTAFAFASLLVFDADPRKPSPLAVYVVASALGFYTVPSFLYPFASITVLVAARAAWSKEWRVVRSLLIAGGLVAALVLTLYAPVFLVSGLGAVASNPNVQRWPRGIVLTRLPAHLAAMADWLFGVRAGGIAIAIAIAAASVSVIRSTVAPHTHTVLAMMLGVLLLPPVVVLVHGAIPFERTWIYLLVPLYVLVTALLDRAVACVPARGWRWALPVVVVATAALGAAGFPRRYAREYARDFEADWLFTDFPSASVRTLVHNEVYFADLLTYKLQLEQQAPIVARRLTPGMALGADALILSPASVPPAALVAYTPWRQSASVTVYLRDRPVRR